MRPAIPDIVEEHLEELAFLAIRRRTLLFSATATRRQLLRQEARAEAHRAGLRVAGPAAIDLAVGSLDESDDPWMVAAAAWTWLEFASPSPPAVAERLTAVPPELVASWREALRWCAPETSAAVLAGAEDPRRLHLALDAAAWHGSLDAATAATAADDRAAAVRWVVARHAGHALAVETAGPLLAGLLDDSDAQVRAAALWSLALVRPDEALARALRGGDPMRLRVLGLFGGDDVLPTLASALADPATATTACAALADHGSRAAVAALAAHPDLPAAGDALVTVLAAAPATPEAADAAWQQAAGLLPGSGARVRAGARQPADDSSNEALWRAAIAAGAPDPHRLRRELPDGLLDGAPREDALPGT